MRATTGVVGGRFGHAHLIGGTSSWSAAALLRMFVQRGLFSAPSSPVAMMIPEDDTRELTTLAVPYATCRRVQSRT